MKLQTTQCAAVIIWMSEIFAGFTESHLFFHPGGYMVCGVLSSIGRSYHLDVII